jgi:acyl-CoA dehydrogenase
MATLFWLVTFFAVFITAAYKRFSLQNATIAMGTWLLAYLLISDGGFLWKTILVLGFAALAILNLKSFREEYLTKPFMHVYRSMLPEMSRTESEALQAGTVWWDGELFSGKPDWNKLLDIPEPRMSQEEIDFLNNEVEELCRMLDDWQITHELGDLPEHIWDFLKSKGFFAMIIPKKYGGKEFSALAHSEVLIKVSGVSITCSSIIAVPNSLGPAELLNHYGTQEQKDYYLPRLADGREIPCFALTGPRAGSDATSLTDSGVVCKGTYKGKEIIGIKLNFSKRYITLAPVATVIGLAFQMRDPDGLMGDIKDYGITAALVPRDTPGITIGRRHFPLNVPFQNGPLQGKDVFIPLGFIIGGREKAGQGWKMLCEQLSVGRCISLPSNATGGAKAAIASSAAYARIRQQFGLPIGKFEGIEEVLARMAARTYFMDAARKMTAGAIDLGEVPSVPSAILKYHLTETGRIVGIDAMDIHGGKGICLGPKNYLGRAYQGTPVAITVEGANIMTRSLIIFGQGAIRCHPYVLKEMESAANPDETQGLKDFDSALFGHIGYAISNAVRSFVMGVSYARFTDVPVEGPTKRYFQHLNRFSSAFALVTDVSMLTLGGKLKFMESTSARLGDMLSMMYLASATLKHYEDQGRPAEDLPLVEWACRDLLYRHQEQLHSLLRNFPNKWIAGLLRFLVFPRGRKYYSPADEWNKDIVSKLMANTPTRQRLTKGIYNTVEPNNPYGLLEEAMQLCIDAEPLLKKIRKAQKAGEFTCDGDERDVYTAAQLAGVITPEEVEQLLHMDDKVMNIVNVDDFAPHELGTKAQVRPELVQGYEDADAA